MPNSSLIELILSENLQQIVINQFSRVAQQERCSFFGNVSLGSSISLSELRDLYDVVSFLLRMLNVDYGCICILVSLSILAVFEQVVLAYGAESDRVLGIAGEVCFVHLVFDRITLFYISNMSFSSHLSLFLFLFEVFVDYF